MRSAALIPDQDDLLLKDSIEVSKCEPSLHSGVSLEALAKGNKKIPEKRKGGSLFLHYYRARRKINSESLNFPILNFFDKHNTFQDHATLNRAAQAGDLMFSDCHANSLISTTDILDKTADLFMREDGSQRLAENFCPLLRDNLMAFFDLGFEPKDDTHMHKSDSDNSSAITDVEYGTLPDSLLSSSNKDYILCNLNTEDTNDYVLNSPLLDSPENVLEDTSFHGDEEDICHWEADVDLTSISHLSSVSKEKIICTLNTEDPVIPCNDNTFLRSFSPQIATDSIDPAPSCTKSQMDGPDLSSEFDSGYALRSVSLGHNPSMSDHNIYDSDSNLPCFPDIEALILKLDFEYAQESWITNEGEKRHKHKCDKKTINGTQTSSLQRAMSSLGAFAVFYSHHFNYYIKKTEVTVGRSTDDNDVDIDLRKESHANMISRKQATIKMETDGTFTLKNTGKGSILVNGKPIDHGQVAALSSGCLIQIRGMDFMYEINERFVRWYLDNIIMKEQGKYTTFEWSSSPGGDI